MVIVESHGDTPHPPLSGHFPVVGSRPTQVRRSCLTSTAASAITSGIAAPITVFGIGGQASAGRVSDTAASGTNTSSTTKYEVSSAGADVQNRHRRLRGLQKCRQAGQSSRHALGESTVEGMGEFRTIAVKGANLGFAATGTGPPVLLIPGGGGCSDYLAPVAQQLSGFRVYRVEPRGCGRSDHDGRYDLETTLDDFDALLDQFGLERWVVGGHSHGAFLALAYALRRPDRTRAVLYLAGTGIQNDRSWHAAYDNDRSAGHDREVPPGTYTWNAECSAVANADYKEYVPRSTLWYDIAHLPIPLRAVHGGLDIRPVWPVEQLVAAAPDAKLRMIPGAPHDFWYTHPQQLGSILRQELEELRPGERA
ncbi:alpha/beta hydrolase [Nocardia sp. NPDC023852]|uniref:alpha/beta fold hydrolase n=1 Tax=Nocardia sp. NPDC023852 TaxID=3154697 RepID=UPI0033D9711E